MKSNRREFLKTSTVAAAGVLASAPIHTKSYAKNSPNETVNVAVIGIRNRGKDHYKTLARIPNVKIAALCDIDENLLAEAVADVEEITGHKPESETEYRKILEKKNVDAVSIVTPNHWHALQTIWACQAGKDVYVEKPVSHTIVEGRKMVEAARKYNRVVQTGTQSRSSEAVNAAFHFMREGGLGDIYMAKGLCFKQRASIGHTSDSEIPEGVNWDIFLGPAPYRPFNENRFHYKWHWFWDTGNGDLGNQGPHQADIARWALNKQTHPVRIQSIGDYFIWDSDQETPNVQHISYEYEDGSILQFEVRGLATNAEADTRIGNLIFGSKGWMNILSEDDGKSMVRYADINLKTSGFSSYQEELGPMFSNENAENPDPNYNHFKNFIDCVRSERWQDLNADILEGHLSSSLSHLGNIACRLKRTLEFNPNEEQFVNDEEADSYLTKIYRAPYNLPDII
ncbi:Gfo/Idh/MocA family oxidoreductase [candidate division KSB1 bacterium]|nr:Gfo/Idh/MocA family oxidoreductase [candidate division KSB1 bacterium]